jgi:phosphonoacetaldehyde hydrolase
MMSSKPLQIRAVIFDWAGTTVDYGSRAPVRVFQEIFERVGLPVTEAEAREPMGQAKREHIAALLGMPRIRLAWQQKFGAPPHDADIDRLYADFLPLQLEVLARGSEVIPGIPELVTQLRSAGLRLGSTTGYTRALMEVVRPAARAQNFEPEVVICADDVPAGRPAPWMNWRACEALGVYPPAAVIAVDDTPVGIQAARHAGMWAVGITQTGNGLGLDLAGARALPADELARRLARLEQEYLAAGAHYVLPSATELPALLSQINARLATELPS